METKFKFKHVSIEKAEGEFAAPQAAIEKLGFVPRFAIVEDGLVHQFAGSKWQAESMAKNQDQEIDRQNAIDEKIEDMLDDLLSDFPDLEYEDIKDRVKSSVILY